MRCWRRCRSGLQGWLETFLFLISVFFFFFSEKPTGPNRFRAVLTQLVPGTHGPVPYPCSGNVLGHAGETITSAGNRLANSEFHTRHKSPEPCAFLRAHMWKGRGDAVGSGSQTPPNPESSEDPGRTCWRRGPTSSKPARSLPRWRTEALCKPLEKRSEPVSGRLMHDARLAERQAVAFHSRTSHSRSVPVCLTKKTTIIDHLVFILQNLLTRPEHWNYSPVLFVVFNKVFFGPVAQLLQISSFFFLFFFALTKM